MVVECSWSKSQLLFGLTGSPCNWAVEHSSTSRPTLKVLLRHHRTSFQPSQNTMDRLDLSSMYSMKNIPHPGCFEYFKLLVLKMEHFNRRLRWKTYFLQNPEKKVESDRECYGFKSGKALPHVPDLVSFEKDFYDMIKQIEFRHNQNEFRQQISNDLHKLSKTKEVVIAVDKTRNLYKIKRSEYKRLLLENITKEYRRQATKM